MSKAVKQRAILVEGILNRKEGDHFAELTELAYVAGYDVVERITQNINSPHPIHFFGKGKVSEIKGQIKQQKADVVIIENSLDPLQLSELKMRWHVEIIDRFELILEIFIKKAGTQEAITQIRLAALKKQTKTRLEAHRTVVERNKVIRKLEHKLSVIKKQKDIRRKRRSESGFDLVAIAGYTNAGKSTLMNAFTRADVEVSGKMFTTLDTTTRSFDTFGRKILITDTVGFISRLPHVLMDAFYATLKEVKEADLILLLIDGVDSTENIKKKVIASMNTLGAIDADVLPLIPVLTKIDIAQNIEDKEEIIKAVMLKDPVKISAKEETFLDVLKETILKVLATYRFHIKIKNTSEGMSLVSKIHNKTRIVNEVYHHENVEMQFETNVRLGQHLYNLLQKSNLLVEILNKDELDRQVKKDVEEEITEDTLTTMKLEDGDEFVVFDLIEESKKKETDGKKESAEDLSQKTTLD
ncbi:MAG: HflX GTPase family protein [Candidatus Heimdallarchaeota archaeon]